MNVQTYTTKGSAYKGAQRALAKKGVVNALSQVHFNLHENDPGIFTWSEIDYGGAKDETGATSPEAKANDVAVAEQDERNSMTHDFGPLRPGSNREKMTRYFAANIGNPVSITALGEAVYGHYDPATMKGQLLMVLKGFKEVQLAKQNLPLEIVKTKQNKEIFFALTPTD